MCNCIRSGKISNGNGTEPIRQRDNIREPFIILGGYTVGFSPYSDDHLELLHAIEQKEPARDGKFEYKVIITCIVVKD
jgi:hypothetical protein